jgi:hypothetical protein
VLHGPASEPIRLATISPGCRAEKPIARLVTAVRAMTGQGEARKTVRQKVTELDRLLDGWANRFCLGSVRAAFSAL